MELVYVDDSIVVCVKPSGAKSTDEPGGVPELVEAVRQYYAKLDIHYTADEILITTGGSEALSMVMQCILDDGDEIIIPEPFYPNYNTFVSLTGGKIAPIPTTPEEGYHYADRAKVEACITEKTRAIMITNPGNPTGVVIDQDEMRMIADIAKKHDLFLICDEVYREFCYDDKFGVPTMGRFRDIDENLVIVDSVSKRFSACGARVGCVVTRNKELQQARNDYNAMMSAINERSSISNCPFSTPSESIVVRRIFSLRSKRCLMRLTLHMSRKNSARILPLRCTTSLIAVRWA